MMMSRDQQYADQAFRPFAPNEPSPNESAVLASRDCKRERNEDPSFLPPRIGENQSFTMGASFSSVGDNQDDDATEPTVKRARHAFSEHDYDSYHGSNEGNHPFLDPLPNEPAGFLDPECVVHQPWLHQPNLQHQRGDEAFPQSLQFRLGDSFPTGATSADRPPITTNPAHTHTGLTSDVATEDDEEDRKLAATTDGDEADSKPAAAKEDDGKPAALGAALDAVASVAVSFETRGGERTGESPQLEPGIIELEACNNERARDALSVWYQRLSELVDFKKANGHIHVPQKYEANPPLGIWVNKQRCTRTALTPEKIAALETVGFDWGKRKGQHAWNEKFNELIAYKAEHGDCLVPTKCPANPSLGRWVSTQRSQYKSRGAGKRSTMTDDKIRSLESIGFVWSMVDFKNPEYDGLFSDDCPDEEKLLVALVVETIRNIRN